MSNRSYYKNWKFGVGDLVVIDKSGNLESTIGIIIGRTVLHRYVEARPIKIVEFESYQIQSTSLEKIVSIEGDLLSPVS